MLGDKERDVLNRALEKYRPGRSEPILVGGANALKPALHEWDDGNLNAAADQDDIRTITRVINGGLNGLKERTAWLEKILPIASRDCPADA